MRSELIQTRIDKASKLRDLGREPYPYLFERTHTTDQVREDFEAMESKETPLALAGRLMSLRPMGKATFAHLQDAGGRLQIFIRKNEIGEDAYEAFRLLDLGDLVGVRGTAMRTRTGEETLLVKSFDVLSKAIRPLPVVKEKDGEVFDAWQDTGARYRRRYLDLILNPESREAFVIRSKIIRTLRRFLDDRGFLEVETPVLQAVSGGAMARPFVTHHNALDMRFFMRIALELPLKKLLVGGFDKVYELGRVFRNEGVDRSHNPEFTMLEFYWAYADYHEAMDLVEEMIRETVREATGGTSVRWGEHTIDLAPRFGRRSMCDLIREYSGDNLDVLTAPETELRERVTRAGGKVQAYATRGHLINELFELLVEEHLVQPVFVMDHPRAISPLAKAHRTHPETLVERYELFIGCMEFANAFSELNDPVDQRGRFEDQVAQKAQGDEEAQDLDEDYLQAMEYGMPPAAGVGIGVDRLCTFAAGVHAIRDVLLFPHMRPEEGRGADDEGDGEDAGGSAAEEDGVDTIEDDSQTE